MGSRHVSTLAVSALTLLTAVGCGTSATPPSGPAAVQVTVTRDFGATGLVHARAAPSQSAMNALRRTAHVGTAYGGRFVSSINGIEGNTGNGWDWFYFINGIEASRGAADYTLHPGDHEWWDYRYSAGYIHVPVAIGAWPDLFGARFQRYPATRARERPQGAPTSWPKP